MVHFSPGGDGLSGFPISTVTLPSASAKRPRLQGLPRGCVCVWGVWSLPIYRSTGINVATLLQVCHFPNVVLVNVLVSVTTYHEKVTVHIKYTTLDVFQLYFCSSDVCSASQAHYFSGELFEAYYC